MIAIEIGYANNAVRSVFSDFRRLEKKIGNVLSKCAKKRIDSFIAATSYDEILALNIGKPHSLTGDLFGFHAITMTANVRLIYKVSDNTIILKGVCDYHGQKQNWIIP